MPCRLTSRHSAPSTTTSSASGCGRCGVAAKRLARRGSGSRRSPPTIFRSRKSYIRGHSSDLPSPTQGGSRVREFRSRGSVRGAVGNDRPYRERASRVHTGVRNSARDEGGPFGLGDQEQSPSHCKLLRSNAVVVSVAVKVRTSVWPAGSREASASEPLQKRRKRIR